MFSLPQKINIHIVLNLLRDTLRAVDDKDGQCPAIPQESVGTCVHECDDKDPKKACDEGYKCCSNGCGHVCVKAPELDRIVFNLYVRGLSWRDEMADQSNLVHKQIKQFIEKEFGEHGGELTFLKLSDNYGCIYIYVEWDVDKPQDITKLTDGIDNSSVVINGTKATVSKRACSPVGFAEKLIANVTVNAPWYPELENTSSGTYTFMASQIETALDTFMEGRGLSGYKSSKILSFYPVAASSALAGRQKRQVQYYLGISIELKFTSSLPVDGLLQARDVLVKKGLPMGDEVFGLREIQFGEKVTFPTQVPNTVDFQEKIVTNVTVDEQWEAQLEDASSERYKSMASQIEAGLDFYLGTIKLPNYKSSKILSFYPVESTSASGGRKKRQALYYLGISIELKFTNSLPVDGLLQARDVLLKKGLPVGDEVYGLREIQFGAMETNPKTGMSVIPCGVQRCENGSLCVEKFDGFQYCACPYGRAGPTCAIKSPEPDRIVFNLYVRGLSWRDEMADQSNLVHKQIKQFIEKEFGEHGGELTFLKLSDNYGCINIYVEWDADKPQDITKLTDGIDNSSVVINGTKATVSKRACSPADLHVLTFNLYARGSPWTDDMADQSGPVHTQIKQFIEKEFGELGGQLRTLQLANNHGCIRIFVEWEAEKPEEILKLADRIGNSSIVINNTQVIVSKRECVPGDADLHVLTFNLYARGSPWTDDMADQSGPVHTQIKQFIEKEFGELGGQLRTLQLANK
ncbi:WAP four-disulfide core domain protein 18 [Elysia marginata]|uniref:WAP four-disulfide core domain protein 18 n=1 Tax=Elysia marginata TaxID=1093978 RepID=A0AAV4JJ19_9GAST|nr:WAP four-disulfide core domain protein 18 [Elysia marginata]